MPKNRKKLKEQRVRRGIRAKIQGTAARPRLCVFRSNQHIYAQLINDEIGHTLAAASSLEDGIGNGETKRVDQGHEVGKRLAERAREKGVEQVVFDRNVYRYHGRVRAVAEGAREGGLKL